MCTTLLTTADWMFTSAEKYIDSWFQTFSVFWMLYAFFWVIPRRLNFTFRRFGTLCLFHLHRQVSVKYSSYLPAYEDGTECSETSECKIQTPGNYPEESIQHSEHGESLKSTNRYILHDKYPLEREIKGEMNYLGKLYEKTEAITEW